MNVTLPIQLRARRASREFVSSPSNEIGAWRIFAGSTLLKACTLTTAYRRPSISLVTTGTTPQRRQVWNSAVRVPKEYWETSAASRTFTRSVAAGFDAHTPRCFWQNVQAHARAGISAGSGAHSRSKQMLPQWQLP